MTRLEVLTDKPTDQYRSSLTNQRVHNVSAVVVRMIVTAMALVVRASAAVRAKT